MRWRRLLVGTGIVLAAAVGFVVWQIGPRNILGMLRYDQRREGLLRVGDLAPDVVLHNLAGEEVHLADYKSDRPLVLIFGSFT